MTNRPMQHHGAYIHEAYVCLGSNEPDAATRVVRAAAALAQVVEQKAFSLPYVTEPAPPASPLGPKYVNAVMRIATPLSLDSLRQTLKGLESAHGRLKEHRTAGRVVIDLDVVVYDGEICRRSEFESSYFSRGYRIVKG